jgi:hypothetical protein
MDAGGKHMYAAIRVAWKLGFVIGCNGHIRDSPANHADTRGARNGPLRGRRE